MPSVQNTERLEVIKHDLEDIQAVWVVDYRGLTVKESEELRNSIREAGATMKVHKNTLVRLALKEMDMPSLDEILSGPSAFVFAAGDPVASAKALKDFAKKNENLVIKGGIMDGAFVDAEAVEKIAALPSREELIAKLLGSLQNPMVKTVRVLNGPMEAFARCVSQIAEQKDAA
ncbi:MAG: 50S ribosomal protein L10 [Eggerthellaceae bacterium]